MKIDKDVLPQEQLFPIINGKVSMAINRKLHRNFRKEGLEITPEQWTVLSYLWHKDGVTQQTLCDATFKDKPSMTRLLDNLTKSGMVERRATPKDRRSNLVFLTEKGRSIEQKATEAANKTSESAFAGIDEEGINQARKLLKIIFQNIEESL